MEAQIFFIIDVLSILMGLWGVSKVRFPSGMKHLANYVHSKGLKFGRYRNFNLYTNYICIYLSSSDVRSFNDVDY